MRRKRVTGRFYVFIILLLIGGYFILRELLPDAAREAIITQGNATYSRSVDAVVVRDETVAAYEGNGRVVYKALEGAFVNAGDEICEVYSAGYSDKEIEKLEKLRQSIRAYHSTILSNIVDNNLDALEARVQSAALKLKTLISKKTGGSLLNLQEELQAAMVARQDYLRQNQRVDMDLNRLYDEETKRVNNIASWKTEAKAETSGVVSFYLDGCEALLKPDNLPSITVDDIKSILSGKTPNTGMSRLQTPIYRVVKTDKWYIILLSSDLTWNPISGQSFTFQMDGFSDVAFSGTVVRMQKTDKEVMAQLEISGSPGPLMNRRYGKASVGAYLSGLSVPVQALVTQSGQTGVVLSDAAGGTFIPAEVLSRDSRYALIQPLVEGTLSVGQRVLLQ